MAIAYVRKEDVALTFKDGYAEAEMLPGSFPHVKCYRCALKAGTTITPPVHIGAQQYICFTGGEGYVTTPLKAFNIGELSFFVTKLGEAYSVHAATDMEYTTFVVEMGEREMAQYNKSRLVMPFFRKLSDADEYWQDCKTEGTRSWQILVGKHAFPIIMGVVKSPSGGTIEKGHPSVAQWNIILDESDIVLTVEEESVDQTTGDFSFVPAGPDHSLVAKPGKRLSYIWFEYYV